jgi:hypothetical protein
MEYIDSHIMCRLRLPVFHELLIVDLFVLRPGYKPNEKSFAVTLFRELTPDSAQEEDLPAQTRGLGRSTEVRIGLAGAIPRL